MKFRWWWTTVTFPSILTQLDGRGKTNSWKESGFRAKDRASIVLPRISLPKPDLSTIFIYLSYLKRNSRRNSKIVRTQTHLFGEDFTASTKAGSANRQTKLASWNYSNFICTLRDRFQETFYTQRCVRSCRTSVERCTHFSPLRIGMCCGDRLFIPLAGSFFPRPTHTDPGFNSFDRRRARKTRSTCRPRERLRILWLFRDARPGSTGLPVVVQSSMVVETFFTRSKCSDK